MIKILEQFQPGYRPFILALSCLLLALFILWLRRNHENPSETAPKLIFVTGLSLGAMLRAWETRAIAIGQSEPDGLPGVGAFIIMAVCFLPLYLCLKHFTKKTKQGSL